jgi:acyl-CoA thioesterase-1
MRTRQVVLVTLVALSLGACARLQGCAPASSGQAGGQAEPGTGMEAALEPAGGAIDIAFLGDSLTAGLGLLSQEAYPAVLEDMLRREGYGEVEVVNAGVSGDTTAGGLRRVDQLLGPSTRVLVVALGGNDALRGLTPAQTHDNLAAIIDRALEANVVVLVAGMLAPTNLGEDYQKAFRETFVRLSREYRGSITFVPFLLEGVAGDPALNQGDGIHPNANGARVIAELLFPHLRQIVGDLLNAQR